LTRRDTRGTESEKIKSNKDILFSVSKLPSAQDLRRYDFLVVVWLGKVARNNVCSLN